MSSDNKIAKFKQRRKNFLPTLFLAILFWGLWLILIFKLSPESNLLLFIFYFLLFSALFLTSGLVTANSRLGLLIAVFALLTLIFRYHQIANPLNLFLLAGIFIAFGFYWVKR